MIEKRIVLVGPSLLDVICTGINGPNKEEQFCKVDVSAGGGCRNVAEVLCRLGNKTTFLTSLGNDHAAIIVKRSLEIVGAKIIAEAMKSTPIYVAMVDQNGTTWVQCADYHSSGLSVDSILENIETLQAASVIVVASDLGMDVIRAVCDCANNEKQILILKAANVETLQQSKNAFNMFDYLFMNRCEASRLSQMTLDSSEPILTAINQTASYVRKGVFITLGRDGVGYSLKTKSPMIIPAEPIGGRIVSTVGAGDVFLGGVVHGIIRYLDIRKCIMVGQKLAAWAITYREKVPKDSEIYEKIMLIN